MALAKTREALAPLAKDKAADQARSEPRKVTLSLRDRDLSYADPTSAPTFGRSTWRGEHAGGELASWRSCRARTSSGAAAGRDLGAQLQGADLLCGAAAGRRTSRRRSCRARASLEAQLQGADLSWGAAAGRGPQLRSAQLQGANLTQAQLQGANLDAGRELQGANLISSAAAGRGPQSRRSCRARTSGAQLQGAKLAACELSTALAALSRRADAISGALPARVPAQASPTRGAST